jgi:hypothetical protein
MKNLKIYSLLTLLVGSMLMTGCLNILEEVTFKKDGSGMYSMMIDMGEMKSMMDMFKNMAPGADSTGTAITEGEKDMNSEDVNQAPPPAPEEAAAPSDMSQIGEQLTGGVAKSLKGIAGISNVVEVNDTAAYKFGYTFEFANVDALNKAIKIINKEKYDAKADETYKFSKKKFERLGAANIGEELKKALTEGGEEGGEEGSMDMLKSFFADMTYTQVYNFPDKKAKSSSNSLSEITNDGHTITIKQKPFSEDDSMKKAGIMTEIKLK